MRYYFDIPCRQKDLYLKHIIEGIYGVKDNNFTVTRETRESIRIEITVDPQIPLINSLPETKLLDGMAPTYHADKRLVTNVGNKFYDTIMDYNHPIGVFYHLPNKITLAPQELGLIIRELARQQIITRFAQIDDNRFAIYIYPYMIVLIAKVIDDTLVVTIFDMNRSTFDVDDGYSGIFSVLNPAWEQWKKNGDITAPIQPPNHV